jgi:DNA-binding GntR family transcriptional regulator
LTIIYSGYIIHFANIRRMVERSQMVTNTQQAYDQIKNWIITTQMRPGSVIQETSLMEALGLGRTPVREALKRLEIEKLVVVSPRRGMFVADVTISDLAHIQEVRSALDPLCVRLAVERSTPDEQAEIKRQIELLAATNDTDLDGQMVLDRQIHKLLAQSTHNKFLEQEIELFYNLSTRIWHLYMTQLKSEELALEEFMEIMRAMETKDANRAELAILKHIRSFGESIKRLL